MPAIPLPDAADRLREISVVYTDLDGTMMGRGGSFLHGPDGTPTLDPARALLAAHEAGIDIVPVSGRALTGLLYDARVLSLPTVIADMGAQIAYRFGAEVIENYGATPDHGLTPVRVMEQTGAIDLLLGTYEGRLEFHAPWHRTRDCTQLFRGLVDPAEVDDLLAVNGHDWLTLIDNGRLHGAYLGLPRGTAHVYHLIPKGVSKGAAVSIDRERRGIPLEHTLAIGDSLADLQLAGSVGTFVLVADALEHDERLAPIVDAADNVVVTVRPQNLGWADTIAAVCARD